MTFYKTKEASKTGSQSGYVHVHPKCIIVSLQHTMETNELFEHENYKKVLNHIKPFISKNELNKIKVYLENQELIKPHITPDAGEQISLF